MQTISVSKERISEFPATTNETKGIDVFVSELDQTESEEISEIVALSLKYSLDNKECLERLRMGTNWTDNCCWC